MTALENTLRAPPALENVAGSRIDLELPPIDLDELLAKIGDEAARRQGVPSPSLRRTAEIAPNDPISNWNQTQANIAHAERFVHIGVALPDMSAFRGIKR